MKAKEKKILAMKCIDRFDELGLEVEVQGNFIVMTPPPKVPTELLLDVGDCSDELIKILDSVAKSEEKQNKQNKS